MHRVFVYGTLGRGFPHFRRCHAPASFRRSLLDVRERFPLVIAGTSCVPTLIFEPGRGHRVVGEVFEVDAADWRTWTTSKATTSP
ncbi:MAG: gamma-glutamylcyclotransferase [Gammaproteobacteria bacterium]|nr:gamma-glutamylcyclotransferase [Gammaproteobacteria bacterium]